MNPSTIIPNALVSRVPELGPAGTQIMVVLMRWRNAPRPPTDTEIEQQTGLSRRWVSARRSAVEAIIEQCVGGNAIPENANSVPTIGNSVLARKDAANGNSVPENENSVPFFGNSVPTLKENKVKEKRKRKVISISDGASILRTPPIEGSISTTQFEAESELPVKLAGLSQHALFGLVRELCVGNFATGRVGEVATKLHKAGATDANMKHFKAWWYAVDYRGLKGQPPMPELIWQQWPIAMAWNGATRQGKPAPADAKKAQDVFEEALKSW